MHILRKLLEGIEYLMFCWSKHFAIHNITLIVIKRNAYNSQTFINITFCKETFELRFLFSRFLGEKKQIHPKTRSLHKLKIKNTNIVWASYLYHGKSCICFVSQPFFPIIIVFQVDSDNENSPWSVCFDVRSYCHEFLLAWEKPGPILYLTAVTFYDVLYISCVHFHLIPVVENINDLHRHQKQETENTSSPSDPFLT